MANYKKLLRRDAYLLGKSRATSEAIEYQAREKVESWGDVSLMNERFKKMAKRYGLIKEFKENGII